jgi:hypothetical protein
MSRSAACMYDGRFKKKKKRYLRLIFQANSRERGETA